MDRDERDNRKQGPSILLIIFVAIIAVALVCGAAYVIKERFDMKGFLKEVIPVETETETETEEAAETESRIESETIPETEIGSESEMNTEAETESESETRTESETSLESKTSTKEEIKKGTETESETITEAETEVETGTETETGIEKESETGTESETETETETEIVVFYDIPDVLEEDIYTFMQGPKAYKDKVKYSGEWCSKNLDSGEFSEFGCGMCCMANLYSTFSPYECSPLDMYYYAKEVTDYSPGGGYGAIAWEYMKKALNTAGFTSKLYKKDELYRGFVRNIEKGWAAIALVSCDDSDKFWTTTPGHYITIWGYDKETRTVFLGDSGDPSHNRTRIPLEYVYSALKTADKYQYLLITSYQEELNTWKHDGIAEKWNTPDGYTEKSKR